LTGAAFGAIYGSGVIRRAGGAPLFRVGATPAAGTPSY